ncbi:sodium/hydrogen exchanger 9-like [Hypomesus transpacificus]|uniref:sodium/hydrogen exchanger 9-like n=1 Tax=Hypomesus transpacificus TaxID=137520 RepID=UPI001F083749|nr:sodium/hydrogen exchanger 9-like [Hypomesus transpacificus]
MMTGIMKHRQDSVMLLSLNALLIVSILSMWWLKQRQFRCTHVSGVAMLYGMVLGAIMKSVDFVYRDEPMEVYACVGLNNTPLTLTVNVTSHVHHYKHVGEVNFLEGQGSSLITDLYKMTFDPEVLFNLFLPPIIFHGAYCLNQRRFIDNLGSVLTFAFMGTIITCVGIGACVYAFTRLMVVAGQSAEGDFLLTDCFLFGAVISATDPVAVLALFSELRVEPDLYTLLFGESVLNDAVAIVLARAITTYSLTGGVHAFDTRAFFLAVGHFVAVFSGSFAVGFFYTAVTALLTKFTRLCEHPLLETTLLFLLSWSAFLCAEVCGLSGIVAVLFCGMAQARYTIHNLSSEAKIRTKQLLEFFSFLGEMFIFCYIGFVLLTFPRHVFSAFFICGAFLSVLVSRACNIYPLAFLLNLGRRNKIPLNGQHFMMFSGLRGAVAFALAVQDTSTEARRTILSTTLLLVCITMLGLGPATSPMLRWLNIRVGVDEDEDKVSVQGRTERGAAGEGRVDTTAGLWHRLEHKYLGPTLTHSGPPLTSTLPLWCGPLARLLTSPHAYENQERLRDDADAGRTEVNLKEALGDQGGSVGGVAEPHEDPLEGDLGLGSTPATAGGEE